MSQGGVRPGAGRKCLAPGQKKVPVTFSMKQTTQDMLRGLRKGGYPINNVLETIINKSYRACVLHRIERLDLDNKGILSDASFEDFGNPE